MLASTVLLIQYGLPEQMKYLLNRIRNIRRKLFLSPPPGHYSSPIVDPVEMRMRASELFSYNTRTIAGVDLNEAFQLMLLSEFEKYYCDVPYSDERGNGRYFYNNGYYLHSDAIFLYSILRHYKPRRIVEIGAGFSSAAMLDAADALGLSGVNFVFIEPYPDRLKSILRTDDYLRCTLVDNKLENIDLKLFDDLEENDILFVDSSHVCKTGSDVNKIFFEILPRLKKNVLVHFHDIFFPFEYPQSWVLDWNSFGWNENYLLRAFLMYNAAFEIVFFNTYLEHFHQERFKRTMPDCLNNPGGSIWIRKK